MQGIFISYRRQDSQSAAGRLADSLKEQLPEAAVFRDVETIEAGVDFVNAINTALGSCGVVLVVIGPRWVSIQDAAGRRRLDDAGDYIRVEVATALARADVRVIPVLVDGATMPDPEALPADLQPLARRNALELTDKRWDYDVAQLVTTLRRALGFELRGAVIRAWHRPLAVLAVLLAVAAGYVLFQARTPPARGTAVPIAVERIDRVPAAPDRGVPALPPAPAGAAVSGDPAESCPTRLSINPDLPTPFTCLCRPEKLQEGSVWGTDDYTDDSSLCRAALHAGVIPAGGGEVTVLRGAGRSLYIGSRRNGIQSSDYGAYSASIRFAGTPAPTGGPEPCPARLSVNPNLPTPFACLCDAGKIQQGSVWGTDVYTDDSGLCRAAVHAGAIPAAGGLVTVVRTAGRPLYSGSSRNGIQSSDYGAYSASIRFQ